MVSILACPRCSELPSVWLSNRFFMMAIVCSTNWVFVSLMGTWKKEIKDLSSIALIVPPHIMARLWDNRIDNLSAERPHQTHRTLRIKELANAVPQLVEEHGVQGRVELQPEEVLHISANVQTNSVMTTHQKGQKTVQEAADGCLTGGRRRAGGSRGQRVGHVAGPHGDHGVFALGRGPHGGAVCDGTRGAALLEAYPTQSTQKSCHVDPLLLWRTQRR